MSSTPGGNDPHNLQRFLDAQRGPYANARAELGRGAKQSHWMWFIFPQLKGLGVSQASLFYGISGKDEALAYLRHEVLGPRLRDCTRLVNAIEGRTVEQIFGYPDNMKFRSSMTLFAEITADNGEFVSALEKYFGGERDKATLARL
jgi:uncharacterized protein (DUF1810 family)